MAKKIYRESPQAARRRLLISELVLMGYVEHSDIRFQLRQRYELQVDLKMISRDLKVVKERWRDLSSTYIEHALDRELQGCNRIEREAWKEWERSKRIQEKTKSKLLKSSTTGEREMTPVEIEQTEQLGDTRYLEQVRWCIAMRSKLAGLGGDAESGAEPADIAKLLKVSRKAASKQADGDSDSTGRSKRTA